MFTVYVIKNENGKIYIGQTADLEKRLARHNQKLPHKKNSYTALQAGNWELIYKEVVDTRKEALDREKKLKSHQGRDYIKRMIP